MQAGLIMVGKQPSSFLTHLITGSVAQRLAVCTASDVLITPLDSLHTAAMADNLC